MSSPGNVDIEKALDELPDVVADALQSWRIATLDREKVEAILYAAVKGQDEKMTAAEVKAAIHSNADRYEAVLNEIKAESRYTMVYERLLSAKKRASLRVAF